MVTGIVVCSMDGVNHTELVQLSLQATDGIGDDSYELVTMIRRNFSRL